MQKTFWCGRTCCGTCYINYTANVTTCEPEPYRRNGTTLTHFTLMTFLFHNNVPYLMSKNKMPPLNTQF